MSLTRALREELARRPGDPEEVRAAETATALRHGGAWLRRGRHSGPAWAFETPVAPAARRVRAAVAARTQDPPTFEARRPGGLTQEAWWRVVVEDAVVLAELGLTDAEGRPRPPTTPTDDGAQAGVVRGALLAAGTLSAPGQAPYLEARAPSQSSADILVEALATLGVPAVAGARGDGWRVVVKSGESIGDLLAKLGAHATFLAFDDGRLRRQLRGEANRAANAERANLSRSVEASSRQSAAIARLIASISLDELPEDLREAALARLANPGASLAELGRLLGVGRASVHRRLVRLETLAAEADAVGEQ